jgi:hypothetical protein
MFQTGTTPFNADATSVSVTFPTAFTTVPDVILAGVSNISSDGTKNFIGAEVVAKTEEGFTCLLAGTVNTSNYALVWMAGSDSDVLNAMAALSGRKLSSLPSAASLRSPSLLLPVLQQAPTPRMQVLSMDQFWAAVASRAVQAPTSATQGLTPGVPLQLAVDNNWLYISGGTSWGRVQVDFSTAWNAQPFATPFREKEVTLTAVSGQLAYTITFDTAFPVGVVPHVLLSVADYTDSDKSILSWQITSRSNAGFEVTFSSPLPSSNVVVYYLARQLNGLNSQTGGPLYGVQFIVSSGGLADLTTDQMSNIVAGVVVVTTDGVRWAYSGTGDKTSSASYIELSDLTPDWSVITNKPATFAPSAHANTHKSGGSDVIALDTLGAPADNTNLNATTSRHGLLPKLPGDASKVLKGDGSWDTAPAGAADVSVAFISLVAGNNGTAALGHAEKPFYSLQAAYDAGGSVFIFDVGTYGDLSGLGRDIVLIGRGATRTIVGNISGTSGSIYGNGWMNITTGSIYITAPSGSDGTSQEQDSGLDGTSGGAGTDAPEVIVQGLSAQSDVVLMGGTGGTGGAGASASTGSALSGGQGGSGGAGATLTLLDCKVNGTAVSLAGNAGAGGTGGSSLDGSGNGGNGGDGGNASDVPGFVLLKNTHVVSVFSAAANPGAGGTPGTGLVNGNPGNTGSGGPPGTVQLMEFSILDNLPSAGETFDPRQSIAAGAWLP